MRAIVLLVAVMLLWSCRNHESLHGTYISGPDFVGDIYTFRTDSTFTMKGWSCTGNDTGTGKYIVTRDSLIFIFDSVPTYQYPVVVDSTANNADSCGITVFCLDETEPVIFAAVLCQRANGTKAGTQTDLDGMAKFKVARDDFPLTIECRYIGYTTVRTTIPSPNDYALKFTLVSNFTHRILAGTRFAYGIKKLSKRKLILTSTYIDAEGKEEKIESVYRRHWQW